MSCLILEVLTYHKNSTSFGYGKVQPNCMWNFSCGLQWVLWLKDRRGLVGSGNKHTNAHSHSGIFGGNAMSDLRPNFSSFSLFFSTHPPSLFRAVAIFMYGLCRSPRVRFYGFRWCHPRGAVVGWFLGVEMGGADIGQYKNVTRRGPDQASHIPNYQQFTLSASAIKFNRVSQQLAQRKIHRDTDTDTDTCVSVCQPVVKVNWVALSVCVCVCMYAWGAVWGAVLGPPQWAKGGWWWEVKVFAALDSFSLSGRLNA